MQRVSKIHGLFVRDVCLDFFWIFLVKQQLWEQAAGIFLCDSDESDVIVTIYRCVLGGDFCKKSGIIIWNATA